MKIALCQINTTVGDFDGNLEKIEKGAAQAKKLGADLALFPELAICGYPPLDMLERHAFLEGTRKYELELAKRLTLPAIVGSIGRSAAQVGTGVANTAILIENGRVEFVQQKTLLPTYDVFDESRYFTPGESLSLYEFEANGEKLKLGISICEDAWNDEKYWFNRRYNRDPISELVSAGAEILVNISASPYYFGKRRMRENMYSHLARRHKIPLVFVNLVGGNDGLIFDGASAAFSKEGEKVLECLSFCEDIRIYDSKAPYKPLAPVREFHSDLYDALVLGVKDYFAKCGFRKAVVGLSGGIDSALTAAIAVSALGKENVIGVSMPSMYSSYGSIEDAVTLSRNLGMEFHEIPIVDIYDSFMDSLYLVLDRSKEDIAEENLQARIRGAVIMAFANKFGAMALATGNKSELAVGYCTLYGDMNGGLAVLGDVYKTDVYELARFVNRNGEVIPETTLTKPPSAELKPNQLDQDSLPPYNILDEILRRFIEMDQSTDEIIAGGFDKTVVRDVIRRLWRNEYKRRQAAITLKVSVKAFGTGRRFPSACKFDAL